MRSPDGRPSDREAVAGAVWPVPPVAGVLPQAARVRAKPAASKRAVHRFIVSDSFPVRSKGVWWEGRLPALLHPRFHSGDVGLGGLGVHFPGVRPQHQTEGRLGPPEGLQHQPGPLVRVPWLGAVAVVMLDPAAPGGLGVIRDGLLACRRERPEKSVRKAPGSTTMTWMPRGATSFSSALDRPSKAHLEAP